MKRLLLLTFFLGTIFGCQPGQRKVYFDIPFNPSPLTLEKVLGDFDHFRYLIENVYVGYDYLKNEKGVDFSAQFAQARNTLEQLGQKTNRVQTSFLELALYNSLKGINDGHLGIIASRKTYMGHHSNFRSAGIRFKKNGSFYQVVKSNSPEVSVGEIFTGPFNQLYPSLGVSGEEFLLGSFEDADYLRFDFNQKSVTLPLQSLEIPQPHEPIVESEFHHAMGLITVRSLLDVVIPGFNEDTIKNHRRQLESFALMGETSRGVQNLILDFRGNPGGSDTYWYRFLKNLYDLPQDIQESQSESTLITQSTIEGFKNLKYPFIERFQKILNSSGKERVWINKEGSCSQITPGPLGFKGRLIFLFNRETASSGEGIIPILRRLPGTLLLGENSQGLTNFGNLVFYSLPNSGIQLSLATTHFKGMGHDTEGQGYLPDYWIESHEDLVRSLKIILGNQADVFLKNQEKIKLDKKGI